MGWSVNQSLGSQNKFSEDGGGFKLGAMNFVSDLFLYYLLKVEWGK